MSVMFLGGGKSLHSDISGRGFVISKPAKSTLSWANTNLSGLSVIPFLPQMSSHSTALEKLSLMLGAQRSVSSVYLVLFLICATILWYPGCNHLQMLFIPVEQFCICSAPRGL